MSSNLQIPPAASPLAYISEKAAVIYRNWYLFLLSLIPRNIAQNGAAPQNSLLFWNGSQITGDGSLVYSGGGGAGSITLTSGTGESTINFAGGGLISETQSGVTYDYLGNTPQVFNPPSNLTTGAGTTLTGANMLGGALLRTGPGAAFTDTTPSQTVLVTATQQATIAAGLMSASYYGQPWLAINGTAFAWTLQPGTNMVFFGNTSGGNFVIPANSSRQFFLIVRDNNIVSTKANLWG